MYSKFRLANLYNKENEIEKAKEYYTMCVESGMVEAKNNLAGLYFEDENYEQAENYYMQAIENGCRESFENLGRFIL